MAGHKDFIDLEKHGLDELGEDGVLAKLEDGFIEDDDRGQDRISDYALDKLIEDAARIYASKTAEEKLVNVDRALNRIHMRSDIAAWFVPGGTAALNELSGTPSEDVDTE
jgi:hypothetical protein